MKTKLLEIRDDGTFIPVVAFQIDPENEAERYLFARAGYGITKETQNTYVVLWRMAAGAGHATSDSFGWTCGGRTMNIAHEYIKENWDDITTGDVIDVEFILGESQTKKISERLAAR